MDSRVDALRRWQALDADSVAGSAQERLAAAYASALASTLLRDWSRADAALAKAQALLSGRDGAGEARAARLLALLGAQSQLARGAAAAAAAALRPLAGDESRPVTLLAAQAGLAAAPEAAKDDAALQRHADRLQTWVAVHPQDSTAWLLLGQVWARLGQPLRALRAEAESRLALGDLPGAVDRLRAGQRRARDGGAVDFIEVSVIDARLRDIELQRRALAADEKNSQPP
jgi:beta-barrel assembly-enhancing protease